MTARLEIALGMLLQGDRYLLQRRSIDPAIGAAGLIGFFGGKIDGPEDSVKAVCRELREETNFEPDVRDALHLGEIWVTSDYQGEAVRIRAEIFHFEIPYEYPLEALEGELVTLTEAEIRKQLDEMTPATRASFNRLIFGED